MIHRTTAIAAIAISALAVATITRASAQALDTFAVLAGSTITNVPSSGTTITGNVGPSPGSAITGFEINTVTSPYDIFQTDAVAAQAQLDLTTAYNILAGQPGTPIAEQLSGQTLVGGVYSFTDTALLTAGPLTLDGGSDPRSVFIFNIPSQLTTAAGGSFVFINGANPSNVFFRVGSSAIIGTGTAFQGTILALTSISLLNGATITCGAALARNGQVSLDANVIDVNTCGLLPAPVVFADELDDSATDNASNVADAIDAYIDVSGSLPLAFQVLGLLSPADLADALAQIAGEVSTGVAPTGTQAMNSFLDTLTNQGFSGDSGLDVPGDQPGPGRGTVSVLGYARDRSEDTSADWPQVFGNQFTAPDPRRFWAAVYGSDTNVDGDASAGTHDRSSDNYGIVFGMDYQITADTRIGLALSGGATSFNLADGFGSGSSNMFQGAIYSQTVFDAAYISAAIAYAYHDQSIHRATTFDGASYAANFDAYNIAGNLEAGYQIGWFTPYGALRVQSFHTPDYSETSDTGGFALDYEENTTTSTRMELGTRLRHTFALNDGASLTMRIRAAWAHDFTSQSSTNATFQRLPGSQSFSVSGAAAESDSVLLSTGALLMLANGFSLTGSIDSQLAQDSQTYAFSTGVRFKW